MGMDGPEPQAPDGSVVGIVREVLPRALYRVELGTHDEVLAHASGDTRRNFVRLLVGDRVSVAVSPRNRTRGRIIGRV